MNEYAEPGLYNADCMEAMKRFPDGFFDLAVVDPVYGDVTQGGYMKCNHGQHIGTGAAKQKGYHAGLWTQEKTGVEYFDELRRVSKNQIVWGGNYFANMLPPSQCYIVWDKVHPDGIKFADCELAWTSFNKATRMFRFMWNGMLQGDMKNKEVRIHPTQKPVALYQWILSKYAEPGDKILDTHAGSASSLVACHRAGFKAWGFEIDSTYYALASERLEREKQQISVFDLTDGG